MRPPRTLAALAALAAALLATPVASANGRFPAANQLVFHPTDPQRLAIRVTFGVLLSDDGGKRFSWACEQAIGYGGTQDPAIALTGDGSLAVAAFEGLITTHDRGCSFGLVGALKDEFVIDVAVDRKNPSSAVIVTSTGKSNNTFHVQVYETLDDGKSWAPAGSAIPEDFLAETIDAAPSRPERLYVSGFYTTKVDGKLVRHGAIEASDDRGKTWTRHEVDLLDDKSLFIAAVDPSDPDRLYVRTKGVASDRLLLSTDGAKSFQTIHSIEGSMLGFALSPDGSRVAIGGPTGGLLVADTSTHAFSKIADKQIACLTWADGLYACANAFQDGFAVGRSDDDGKTWTALLPAFTAISGPISGCATSPAPDVTCAEDWSNLKKNLGISDNPAGGAGGAANPGAGAAGVAAGAAGASGAPAAAPPGGSSCGCQAPAGRGLGGLALAAALLLARLARRR